METLKKEWQNLHEELVQKIINWVKEHNIADVDFVAFRVDCLSASVDFGKWHPDTDSCLELYKYNEDPDDWGRAENPYLFSA